MRALLAVLSVLVAADECGSAAAAPKSESGVTKASVTIAKGSDGLTTEQRNIRDRLVEDNKPGSIKHLYVISAYSGQVILYSTVRGKVTSSGKRLTPKTVTSQDGHEVGSSFAGVPISIGGEAHRTTEVLQDDGSYGDSTDYLYWWDTKGIYHQHYVAGGQIVHVANQPIAVKSIVLNLETASAP